MWHPMAETSAKAQWILKSMGDSGESAQADIADALDTYAQNDEEAASDEFLINYAKDLALAARSFVNRMRC